MKNVLLVIDRIKPLDEQHILPETIAPRYYNKYLNARSEKARRQALSSGLLLRDYLNITQDSQLTINEYGKPSLTDESAYFSLSHSGDFVILAIADVPVGADIESINKGSLKIAQRTFPIQWVENLESIVSGNLQDFQKTFSEYWTMYEAAIKMIGCGFSKEVSSSEIIKLTANSHTFGHDHYSISVVCAQPFNIQIIIPNNK